MRKNKKRESEVFILIFLLLTLLSAGVDRLLLEVLGSVRHRILDYLMDWVTHTGSVFTVLILMTSLFMWEKKKAEYIAPLWISVFLGVLWSYMLKFLIMRPRPVMLAIPFTTIPDYSFPSTHAAICFAALPILDREFPKLKWFWIFFACLVALSRLYFGVHYLSDVMGGALLGYVIGYCMLRVEEKYRIFRLPRHVL